LENIANESQVGHEQLADVKHAIKIYKKIIEKNPDIVLEIDTP
jgi:hypothetical protein